MQLACVTSPPLQARLVTSRHFAGASARAVVRGGEEEEEPEGMPVAFNGGFGELQKE